MRAVITGGSSGIGFATAQVLGREGYEIIVVSFDEKQQEPTLRLWQRRESRRPIISVM